MKLSEHFTLEEMTRSEYAIRKGIDNIPLSEEEGNLKDLCENVLEEIRDLIGKPIRITSGYRSPLVNKGIGGAKNSQHVQGMAADFHVDDMSIEDLYLAVKNSEIIFDQLIQEFGAWVHVSFNVHHNRRDCFRAVKVKGFDGIVRTSYIKD